MPENDRSAVVYVAAAAPGLLIRLFVAYLRMRRNAVKAERHFYRSLVRNGMDKRMAMELAKDYSDPMSITYWMKNMGSSWKGDGLGKNYKKKGLS